MSYLTPHISKNIKEFLSDTDRIVNLVESFGSPLNITFPEQAALNFLSLDHMLKVHQVKGRIFYATKTNKSVAILRKLSGIKNISIDVASSGELGAALSAGFSSERMEATGPKNDEFLRLCIAHDILINIDDKEEFRRIQEIATKLNTEKKVRVLLRVAHSNRTTSTVQDVRFGLGATELVDVLNDCINSVIGAN